MASRHIKSFTLTSKKNWWLVEVDPEEDPTGSTHSFGSDHTAVAENTSIHTHAHSTTHGRYTHLATPIASRGETPPPSPPVYNPPRHPNSIFSFPTPTSYSAPSNPVANLSPIAFGSASELFKCIVKKPNVVQLEINGEMQSNAYDVTTQFLAELRVYTTVTRHRNIATFLGSLENVGMVLEYIDGRTLYDVIKVRPPLSRSQKIDYHNQLLDGLTHLHSFGLSHGDLSLLNVQVTNVSDTIKLLDFGRSVSSSSIYTSPDAEPVDPFKFLSHSSSGHKFHITVEQIHPGTRPFSAPEILRGECRDHRLADAYSFGVILVCLDRCESVDLKPWEQRKDLIPAGFLDGCEVFAERCGQYLRRWNQRRRLMREDLSDF
ncbi:kinase-like protein [Thelephora terrestris]|uniref:Kinase-like protein n=1 Tax=Thelephora terrestris TaxID=56493 RepID=A0A9P6HQU6_9AGAM|nr:kinase-like protein [Thelephora terrestris]